MNKFLAETTPVDSVGPITHTYARTHALTHAAVIGVVWLSLLVVRLFVVVVCYFCSCYLVLFSGVN